MPISTAQYEALLARVTALEETLSNVLHALPALVTGNQLNQLRMLDDTRLEDLDNRVQGLENQLELIVNDPT